MFLTPASVAPIFASWTGTTFLIAGREELHRLLEIVAMEINTLLRELIALAERKRARTFDLGITEHYSHKGFVGEFCTIRLGAPRQSGHTTAIKEALPLFEDALIVAPYRDQLDLYRGVKADLVSAKAMSGGGMRGRGFYDAIFVDCATYLERDKETRGVLDILVTMVKPKTGWLILIG